MAGGAASRGAAGGDHGEDCCCGARGRGCCQAAEGGGVLMTSFLFVTMQRLFCCGEIGGEITKYYFLATGSCVSLLQGLNDFGVL